MPIPLTRADRELLESCRTLDHPAHLFAARYRLLEFFELGLVVQVQQRVHGPEYLLTTAGEDALLRGTY